jgi:DNA-binding CsgD family transcriptional regulator
MPRQQLEAGGRRAESWAAAYSLLVLSRVVLRGRAGELGVVLGAMRRAARTGAGAMIVLTGEPGIGKSALLRAVVEQASQSGAMIGVGRAEEIDEIAPGAPLLLALRSGPRPLVDSSAFAGLAPLYDQQLWLVEQISVMLEDAAAHAPVVIALDDVHWADRLTRFALRVLPGRLAACPVTWVLTSRLAPAQVIDEITRAAGGVVPVTGVALWPLAPADIDDLAADRLGEPANEETRELLRGTGGNPFWAVQVLDGLAWRQAHGLTHDNMHAELIDDVRRRLLPLEAETAALVKLAAVWGRSLPVEDAARLLGDLPAARVLRAARQAADNGLLTSGEPGVDFAHTLVRDAVYADISLPEREALHRTCGRYLLGTRATALAAAPHFRAVATCGDLEVVDVLMRAAADSAATIPDQAAELAQEAFSLVPADHPRWFAVGEQVVKLLVQVQREGAVLSVAGHLIAGTKDSTVGARLQVQVCRALWAVGACHEIERRVDITLRLDGLPPAVRAQLSATRALASTRTESAASAGHAAEAALASGRHLVDEVTQRNALLALAETARNEGRHQLVLDRLTELRSLARSDYLAEEIRALQHLDRYAEADVLLAKSQQEAQDNVGTVLPSFLYAQMWQDHNLARFDAAEAGARALLRLGWQIGNFAHEINARMILAAVAIYRGDLARARTMLQPAMAREESRDELRVSRLRLMQGWLAAAEGNLDASLDILRPLVSAATEGIDAWCWSPPWMRTFAGIGLAAEDGRFAQATATIAELGAERNPEVPTMAGVALQVRGLVDADVHSLGRAVDVLRQGPRPLLFAQALADYAAALRAAGDTAGDARMQEAVTWFDALGAVPGAMAGTVGPGTLPPRRHRPGSRARRPAHGLAALTETERRVADLISAGHSSRSAAAELGVSLNTVNTHLRSAFAKLDVRSRVQLTNLLRDHAPGQQPNQAPVPHLSW